jgi:hypothetical protein
LNGLNEGGLDVRGPGEGCQEGRRNQLLQKLEADYKSIQANFGLNYQFGRAADPSVLLAVPYKAAQTPVDRSSFSDIDVTALLTAHMVVSEGLLERDFELPLGSPTAAPEPPDPPPGRGQQG